MIDSIREQKPDICIRSVDQSGIEFGPDDSNCSYFAWVDNHYQSHLLNPDDLMGSVETFTRSMLAVMMEEDNLDDALNRLVVVLRPEGFVAAYQGAVVSKPFAGDMRAILMLDSEERLNSVSDDTLTQLSIGSDEAFELAAKNIPERIGRVDTDKIAGVDLVAADSGLATSALWLPDACKPSTPEYVVLLVNRDYYFSAKASNKRDTAMFWQVAAAAIAAGESMSATPLLCKNGKWTSATP